VAAASTDAAANGLNTNTELCGNGSQANSASLVGGADGRAPRVMDCRSTNRPAALFRHTRRLEIELEVVSAVAEFRKLALLGCY
jgi:hypothetical protein